MPFDTLSGFGDSACATTVPAIVAWCAESVSMRFTSSPRTVSVNIKPLPAALPAVSPAS